MINMLSRISNARHIHLKLISTCEIYKNMLDNKLLVKVSEGELQGKYEKSCNNVEYRSFQGIPYAKPPLGNLRFKAPQPMEKWKGIRNATTQGADCYSASLITNLIVGSEDCLFLNVYTPKSSKSPLPVMFWIHGGGFVRGSGSTELFGPDYLIDKDVVLVTINYRLGPLGFLAFSNPDTGVPGNAGLKDIVMALKWVQKNIAQFGGDCNNVTIFGESAGAAAVHFLILSPTAKGLFHKAISQSGCALNPFSHGAGSNTTYRLANILGIRSNDDKFILSQLQKIPIEELFEASQKISDPFYVSDIRPFSPVIEPKLPGAFLAEDPVNIMKSGRYNHVPYITGFNSQEGLFLYISAKRDAKKLIKDDSMVPHTLKLRKKSPEYQKTADRIRAMYGVVENSEDLQNILKIHTHNFFQSDIIRTAKLLTSSSKHPVYLYRFDLDTSLNILKMLSGLDIKGAGHADDLPYLFQNMIAPSPDSDSKEYELIQKVTTLWSNFAKYGDPTPSSSRNDCTWKPAAKDKLHYLSMENDSFKLKSDPDKEFMEFWEKLFNERDILLSKL